MDGLSRRSPRILRFWYHLHSTRKDMLLLSACLHFRVFEVS